jgi:hypothetical protein
LEAQLTFLKEFIAYEQKVQEEARISTSRIRPEDTKPRGVVDDKRFLPLLRDKAERILLKSPGMELVPATEAFRGAEAAVSDRPRDDLFAIVRWYRPVFTVVEDRIARSEGKPPHVNLSFVDPNEAASKTLLELLENNRRALAGNKIRWQNRDCEQCALPLGRNWVGHRGRRRR